LRDDRERLADILALVWSVVDNDLPGLRKAVVDLLEERT
jgi:uncharacterized protein with HEPN domain